MRQLRNTCICILLAASLILTAVCPAITVRANDQAIKDTNRISYNISSGSNNYDKWATTIKAYLVPLEDGRLMSVNYGSSGTDKALLVRYYQYDNEQQFYVYQEDKAITIGLEFPSFGGFFATDQYYFILTAQNNKEQDNEKKVFRITRFDKEWENPISKELTNCNTTRPFAFGSARMETCGDYLLVRTCREMYKSYDGRNHQSNVTILLNMQTMDIASVGAGYSGPGYVSHSFNQFIKTEDNHMVTIDHGDAYPRGIILNKYKGDLSNGSIGGVANSIRPLVFKGAAGNITTNATVGGFEISDSSYLIAGNSIDQSSENKFSIRNIFVSAVDKTSNEIKHNWLTEDTEGASTGTPHLVKIKENEYLVLWQKNNEEGVIYCAKIDGTGELITEYASPDNDEAEKENTGNNEARIGETGTDHTENNDTVNDETENKPDAQAGSIMALPGDLSDCAPVVVSGGALMWSAVSKNSNDTDLLLYKIDPEELKGADTVSTSAITCIRDEKVTYPPTTVTTITDSSVEEEGEPADVAGNVTGSTGSTGGSTGGAGTGTGTYLPFIKDDAGRQGWDAIIASAQKAAEAPEGGTVAVNMNGTHMVPRRVLESIRGKNTTLVLDTGRGFCWSICGKDITAQAVSDINLYVKAGSGNIPKDVADSTAKGMEYVQLEFAHKGAFGASLTMSVKAVSSNGVLTIGNGSPEKYTGMYANLFSYNSELRKLEFICAGRIGEDGIAGLAVTQGADYMIIVSPQPMGGTEAPKDEEDASVTQPENPQEPAEEAPAEVKSVNLSKTVYTYSGKAKKPSVSVVDANGNPISSKYYTVSYKNNKNVGRATATVTLKDGYSGTIEKVFTIRPASTSIQKTAALSKGFTVKWKKKTAQTSGYQIQYSTSAAFKAGTASKVLVKKTATNKKTIKNLKAAKKYYVRVRTYKTVQDNGKSTKIYSAWSTVKKVKTLK
ncbi:MAG: fibronectin type III domain-containing protein [Eubacterium sp.]|nr:fibronectin type III domain-containing protein [Eubacterium sp.]